MNTSLEMAGIPTNMAAGIANFQSSRPNFEIILFSSEDSTPLNEGM